MRYPIEHVSDNWERRIINNGYVQHREVYRNGSRGEWQFYISGFGPTVEGGTDAVPSLRKAAAMIISSRSMPTTESRSMAAGMTGAIGITETKK